MSTVERDSEQGAAVAEAVEEAAERPLRRDAERNRQRILEAARELFAERGLSVTLDDVAHRAGLGVGTVYRRFSSRDALVEALFEEKLERIVALADSALAMEDPWEGLRSFLEALIARQAHDRGLKDVLLGTSAGRDRVARVREQLRPHAEELIRRAQAAGSLRPDVAATDLPLLQMMVGAVAEVCTADCGQVWQRCLALLIDGLRAGCAPPTPLPGPPLDAEGLEEVMCRWRPARRPAA